MEASTTDYDYRDIHPAKVVHHGINLFDSNVLKDGDTLFFPINYRVKFSGQSRTDFFHQLQDVEGYTTHLLHRS